QFYPSFAAHAQRAAPGEAALTDANRFHRTTRTHLLPQNRYCRHTERTRYQTAFPASCTCSTKHRNSPVEAPDTSGNTPAPCTNESGPKALLLPARIFSTRPPFQGITYSAHCVASHASFVTGSQSRGI